MIIGIIIGAILGIGIVSIILIPKVKHQEKINEEIINQNQQVEQQLNYNQTDLLLIQQKRDLLNNEADKLKDYISSHINQADKDIEDYIKIKKENAELDLEKTLNTLSDEYKKAELSYQKEYLTILEDSTNEFQQEIQKQLEQKQELLNQIQEVGNTLENLRALVNAAVETNKRAAASENQKDFYRVVISQEDIEEIQKLKEVSKFLRDSEPLNKVIWSVYYQKPTNDMISRVVGPEPKRGIYKITNIKTQMCYVGQSGSIGGFAERWRTHIRKALGAENPGRNKLYPAMASTGVENWTFEILEECSNDMLNDREDYWQEFYHALDWGYSIK